MTNKKPKKSTPPAGYQPPKQLTGDEWWDEQVKAYTDIQAAHEPGDPGPDSDKDNKDTVELLAEVEAMHEPGDPGPDYDPDGVNEEEGKSSKRPGLDTRP